MTLEVYLITMENGGEATMGLHFPMREAFSSGPKFRYIFFHIFFLRNDGRNASTMKGTDMYND